jgi:diguanylate cyclase (GGDEF)-like protein
MTTLPAPDLIAEDLGAPRTVWDNLRRSYGAAPPDRSLDLHDLESRVEALLRLPLRRLALPKDIAAAYTARSRKSTRAMMASWCVWTGLLNLPCAGFDFFIMPAAAVPLVLTFRFIISATFLLSAWLLRGGKLAGDEHVIIILPTLFAMIFAGIAGLYSPNQTLLGHYLIFGITVVYTVIMFVRIEQPHAMFLGCAALCVMFACLAASGSNQLAAKLQDATFYAAVMFALLYAKQVQNLYRYRLFLLNTRDELRKSAVVKRNDQLSSIAYTDRLTGIPNRRYFDEICDSISDSTQNLLPLSLCLIDVDHFKNLNDHLGHLQGDRCLRVIATAIRNNLRGGSDILARFGGEEFVILLPATTEDQAHEVVERIRIAVLSLKHPNPNQGCDLVTISAGIATTNGPVNIETLLNNADTALYRAKSAGRNRVCA